MDIHELLKQLKTLTPDAEYSARSRRVILSAPRKEVKRGVWDVILGTLQAGSAIVLTGILILLIVGGFSGAPWLGKPFTPEFDFQSLQAEADAVDIQIQLTEVSYQAQEAGRAGEAELEAQVEEIAPTAAPAPALDEAAPVKTAPQEEPAVYEAQAPLTAEETLAEIMQ
jgi:hypothetical protein